MTQSKAQVAGLTGGIATGKSVVTALFQELGAKVVDADEIAREIVKPGESAWQEIVQAFGRDVLNQDQTLNREKLRKLVFNDPAVRTKLNSIMHPRIRDRAQNKIAELTATGGELVLYVAPLFFENHVHHWLRPVILVSCDLATQKRRLKARDGLTEEEVENHLRAQMSLEDKKKLADFVIDNSGELQELRPQVTKLWEILTATSPARDNAPPKDPPEHGPRSE
ncbi:MAG: dephospho-CoA kinase [Deltaproteobacteria bacterium]|nr:dephospho-CoA kinase [Deltaproteobacteria bacterium]